MRQGAAFRSHAAGPGSLAGHRRPPCRRGGSARRAAARSRLPDGATGCRSTAGPGGMAAVKPPGRRGEGGGCARRSPAGRGRPARPRGRCPTGAVPLLSGRASRWWLRRCGGLCRPVPPRWCAPDRVLSIPAQVAARRSSRAPAHQACTSRLCARPLGAALPPHRVFPPHSVPHARRIRRAAGAWPPRARRSVAARYACAAHRPAAAPAVRCARAPPSMCAPATPTDGGLTDRGRLAGVGFADNSIPPPSLARSAPCWWQQEVMKSGSMENLRYSSWKALHQSEAGISA
jgi:hypothetical protein